MLLQQSPRESLSNKDILIMGIPVHLSLFIQCCHLQTLGIHSGHDWSANWYILLYIKPDIWWYGLIQARGEVTARHVLIFDQVALLLPEPRRLSWRMSSS